MILSILIISPFLTASLIFILILLSKIKQVGRMAMKNATAVLEFLLIRISNYPEWWVPFFTLVLISYLSTLFGNGLILIHFEPHLHTPIYFFLSNLSFLDLYYGTVSMSQDLLHECLLVLGYSRVPPTGCDGIWSCGCYQQSPAPLYFHECVCLAGCYLMGGITCAHCHGHLIPTSSLLWY